MKRIRLFVVALVFAWLASLFTAPLMVVAAPAQMAGGSGCAQFYVVQFGDRLSRIARRFHTTVRRLAAANRLADPNRILFGQVLCVRGTPPATAAGFFYIVRTGDTLRALGRRFGWSASFLAKVNHIAQPNRIFVAQVLFIPNH